MTTTTEGWTGEAGELARAGALSLGVALCVIAPFFWLGNASGHDIAFHAASWLEAAGQWREGIAYPRWAEWANHGFGEPRFIFYPPLSWMLGAALGSLLPWNAVPMVLIVLLQTAAGTGQFLLARSFLPRNAAFWGAALYAANPYALLILYLRSDFAELLACALLPLLVLAAIELAGPGGGSQPGAGRSVARFALLLASVWLSNAPAGVIATYTVTLLFVWEAIEERSLRPALRGAGGVGLGLGLAGFYLLPAAYEQRWVNIGQALSSGLRPSENFLYSVVADSEHNEFNRIASTSALLLMALVLFAAILARQAGKRSPVAAGFGRVWRWSAVLSGAAAFLMFRASSILWELLPKLRFVQFPWRWMAVLALGFATFGAASVVRAEARHLFVFLAVPALAATAVFFVHRAWWDTEDIPVLREAILSGQGFEGTDEYDPKGDDHTDLPPEGERARLLGGSGNAGPGERVEILAWGPEQKRLRVRTGKPARVELRVLNYPAWQVEVDGALRLPQQPEKGGPIVVPVKAGVSEITVRFSRTPDRWLGGLLSTVCGACLFLLAWGSGAGNRAGRSVRKPALEPGAGLV